MVLLISGFSIIRFKRSVCQFAPFLFFILNGKVNAKSA